MAIVTGDRYLESLLKFVEHNAEPLIEGTLVLKLNPVGLRYVQSRLEALAELEALLCGAPVDYLRAYVSDLGDHRALEQLRRILRLLPSLKVVSVLNSPVRDPTPLTLLPFGRLKVLELRGCDLSASTARGLLELRHTLEKLICHNSTDALRHVFVSRIVEIKNSPQWNRLSFVSCAFNGLVLMDESLQLLPLVETLDLSSNKFAKADNLWKCTKLKHLDLGFNHLRTISSFSEVSCQLVKLVLRNNALTTLRGIQNLKSLEGLDVSYNIISNFSEIEILAGLPSLQNLWLEGNPLCCARCYRALVFSYFPFPDNLRLDEKKISTREFWERQIIIASRQKRPASFGFYSPAKDGAELEGTIDTKRRRTSRLVSIESEDQSTYVCSDQDSGSCDSETQSKEDNAISDEEAEIVDLMNRIEMMKKERSALWLQEFKEWMNPDAYNLLNGRKCTVSTLIVDKEKNMKSSTRDKHLGEPSRYISESVQASGDDSSTNYLESDNSFAASSLGSNVQSYFDQIGENASKSFTGHTGGDSIPIIRSLHLNKENLKSLNNEGHITRPITAIDDIVESQSSSIAPGSPPHYQEDILHRRQNLEEEFLQLSAESFSVASSDSDTSCGEDDSTEFGSCIPQVDQSLIGEYPKRSMDNFSTLLPLDHVDRGGEHKVSPSEQNGACATDVCIEGDPSFGEIREIGSPSLFSVSREPTGMRDGLQFLKQAADWSVKKKHKRKPKRRIISLPEEHSVDFEPEPFYESNGHPDICSDDMKYETIHKSCEDNISNSVDENNTWKISRNTCSDNNYGEIISGRGSLCMESDDQATSFLHLNLADFGVHEPCEQLVCCRCLLQERSGWIESEVAILLSTNNNLYVVPTVGESDGSVTSSELIGCQGVGDIREVFVGLGLQIVKLCCKDKSYLFITRSVERSRKLLDFCVVKNNCSLRSLEEIQVDIFRRHVCGGSEMSIFQYSMVLFWHNNLQDNIWLSRSLFVLKRHIFVCIEDFKQFASLAENTAPSSYFFLDSSCSINNISEMVIDTTKGQYVTLSLECATADFCSAKREGNTEDAALVKGKLSSGPSTWKLKWLSEESLHKFVSLLKAIHAEVTASPLCVRCIT